MQVWNVLHGARGSLKIQDAKNRQKFAMCAPSHKFAGLYTSQLRHASIIAKKYILHVFSQYGEIRPISGWDGFTSLEHPSKFQLVSRVGFVTEPTSLNGGQPNFARCLAVSWASTLYIIYIFGGSYTLREFYQVQNSLCVQVLRSPILAALGLLRGTRVVCVSQSVRRSAEGATYIRQGGHHVLHLPTF